MYSLSSKTPLYTSSTHRLSICSTTPFEKQVPRYVGYHEGSMSFVTPVAIFRYVSNLATGL